MSSLQRESDLCSHRGCPTCDSLNTTGALSEAVIKAVSMLRGYGAARQGAKYANEMK